MRSVSILAVLVILMTTSVRAAEPDPDFHLYLLIGQSNMAGRGTVDDQSRKTHPRVLMLTKGQTWEPATDPLHFDKPSAGVGPGLTFGTLMAEARPTVRIGLIPCAVGGTSITVWVPGAEDKATKTHPYDDMLARVRVARQAGVLTGIIWHQGEANRSDSSKYGEQLTALIARLRGEFATPGIPFVAGELASFKPASAAGTQAFNEVVRGLVGKVPNYACVAADGLDHRGDELHFSSAAARELGRRYAERMLAVQKQAR